MWLAAVARLPSAVRQPSSRPFTVAVAVFAAAATLRIPDIAGMLTRISGDSTVSETAKNALTVLGAASLRGIVAATKLEKRNVHTHRHRLAGAAILALVLLAAFTPAGAHGIDYAGRASPLETAWAVTYWTIFLTAVATSMLGIVSGASAAARTSRTSGQHRCVWLPRCRMRGRVVVGPRNVHPARTEPSRTRCTPGGCVLQAAGARRDGSGGPECHCPRAGVVSGALAAAVVARRASAHRRPASSLVRPHRGCTRDHPQPRERRAAQSTPHEFLPSAHRGPGRASSPSVPTSRRGCVTPPSGPAHRPVTPVANDSS